MGVQEKGFILIRNAHKVEPQMPLPDNYSSHGMVDSVGCLICGMEGKASGFCSIHMLPQGLISHTDPFFFFYVGQPVSYVSP